MVQLSRRIIRANGEVVSAIHGGEISSEPLPPSWELLELAAIGAFGPNGIDGVRHVALERCRCRHVPGAHYALPPLPIGTGLGACTAKLCRKFSLCDRYEISPDFEYVLGSRGTARRYRVGDAGEITPG